MKEFIKNLKCQIMYCMTEEEKEFLDIEGLLYYEFGEDPRQEDINRVIKSLENNFTVIKLNTPYRYIRID